MAAGDESTAAELADFAEFLLQVGEGRHDVNSDLGPDFMKIPKDMLIDNPVEDTSDDDEEIHPGTVPKGMERMVDTMYAEINNPEVATDEYFTNRTILTTTNAMVRRINDAVAQLLEGDIHEYLSTDSVEEDDEASFFEQEVLNTVNINGVPPHKLTLKKGAPIMMMRNLNPNLGLWNEPTDCRPQASRHPCDHYDRRAPRPARVDPTMSSSATPTPTSSRSAYAVSNFQFSLLLR